MDLDAYEFLDDRNDYELSLMEEWHSKQCKDIGNQETKSKDRNRTEDTYVW